MGHKPICDACEQEHLGLVSEVLHEGDHIRWHTYGVGRVLELRSDGEVLVKMDNGRFGALVVARRNLTRVTPLELLAMEAP